MSYIGKNIKKLRSVKKLTQVAFGDIFGVKRANVGAYEEGRAEPKFELLIKIANYFNISTDALLTKELTVNDIAKFNIFKEEYLVKSIGHNEPQAIIKDQTIEMALVDQSSIYAYIEYHRDNAFLESLPTIKLPFRINMTTRAFAYESNNLSSNVFNLINNDVVIGAIVQQKFWKNITLDQCYLMITKDAVVTQTIIDQEENFFVLASDKPEEINARIAKLEVVELWKVVGYYTMNLRTPDSNADRLQSLEDKIDTVLKRLDDSK